MDKPLHIQRRLSILTSLIKEGDEVLDIGCGSGSYITDSLGSLPIKVTAIDSDEKSIEYAKAHNKFPNVEYQLGSGEWFTSDKLYDVIICSHVLEHTDLPNGILWNARLLLKQDGLVFLAVPNGFGCFEFENIVPRLLSESSFGKAIIEKLKDKRVKDTLNADSPHINFFTFNKLGRMIYDNGLEIYQQYNEQVIGGVVSDRTLLKLPMVAQWNLAIGDRLPAWCSNGWIFVCKKRKL